MYRQRFHEQHPYIFVGLLELAVIASAIIAGKITRGFDLHPYSLFGIMMFMLTVITAATTWKLKWWKTIGFRRFNPKHTFILLILTIPVILKLIGGFSPAGFGLVIYYLLLNMMTGFVEEGIFRGLMLRSLLQKGVWIALVIASLLFSLTHIINVLAGWNWQYVLLQASYSFGLGFAYSAFSLKTGTIWPLMIIHCLGNFLSFLKTEDFIQTMKSGEPSAAGIIFRIVLFVVFVAYGIVITRSYIKSEKRRGIYDLKN